MDPETRDKLRKAGKIAAIVRREGAAKLKVPGASFLQVMDYCEDRIKELGGQVAWAQMAVNDVAAHFCPEEHETAVSNEGDLIKIDIGVHLDGWIADNAMTVEVGNSNRYADHMKAARNALRAAIKLVEPGRELWELGVAQMSEAQALGFTTIKNLSGHTIEQYRVHGGISIPTFNNKSKIQLTEGMQVAIEPFITEGDGFVKEKGKNTIWMMRKNANARSPYAKKIITEVAPLNGLPFTNRWLTRKIGRGPTALGLKALHQQGVITAYPPLAERTGGMVAQYEHSMIVGEKTEIYTKHEEDSW
ncbi:TPA: type II methionyl aminopeptidase [Candidatus Woesearchaeota archaeon]|nr:type II methionyl aminopeptidase [archaeon]HIJ12040.1 type II methionyl aminopeptidase [Candidatus Woesearchaeota archaeon]